MNICILIKRIDIRMYIYLNYFYIFNANTLYIFYITYIFLFIHTKFVESLRRIISINNTQKRL